MVNQYKKETSQIHAPADLIYRTKEAVRAEEERLRSGQADFAGQEQPQRETAELPVGMRREKRAVSSGYGRFSFLNRASALIAAAAAVLVLVSVSAVMIRNKPGKDMDIASAGEDADVTADMGAADGYEDNIPAHFEAVEATDEAETSEEEIFTEDLSGIKDAAEEKQEQAGETEMREVSEYPDYYFDWRVEIVSHQGLRFFVMQDGQGVWHAFVNAEEGMFEFDGKAESQEEFLETVYATFFFSEGY